MRIGIFLPNWIGDVVMATPALRGLREHFGDQAHLVGVMRPYVSDVLAGSGWLDDEIVYQRNRLSSVGHLIGELRSQRLDVILLFTNSFSTAAFAWASGAPRRVGFSLHGRQWLLTDRLSPPRLGKELAPRSAVDHYLDVIEVLGSVPTSRATELATTPQEEQAADIAWKKFGWSKQDEVVVLNTGGAYGAAKTWPSEHFSNLARRLVGQRDVRVLFLCGPSEREIVNRICRHADHPSIRSLADQELSLGLSKACVNRSRLMVTTDSGPRHFAAAFDVPAVTIFGPTDPLWSDNYHPHAVNLQLDVECGPCGKRACPLEHHRCMRDLTVDHVNVAATSLLDAARRQKGRAA